MKPPQTPTAPSILIVLMGALGDVTRGLCLVAPIKRALPDSTITWLVEPKWQELVAAHPLVDKVIVFDRPNWWRGGLREIWQLLRSGQFDCVLDLQRHFKSGLFSFFTRAPHRIGFHRKNAKEGNWLFNTTHIPYRDDDYPKINHYLAFLDALGIPRSKTINFGFSDKKSKELAAPLLANINRPFAAMVLGSSWQTKEWGYNGYYELITDMLQTTALNIALVDEPSKRPLADKLMQATASKRLHNLVGQTSVVELAAVLHEAAIAVGPDCGAGHIAAAVNTPYVSLFGPTDPQRTAPYGNDALVVSKNLPCAPCYKARCTRKDIACMRIIDAADVKEKVLLGLASQDVSADPVTHDS